jgi:hypothetical protein
VKSDIELVLEARLHYTPGPGYCRPITSYVKTRDTSLSATCKLSRLAFVDILRLATLSHPKTPPTEPKTPTFPLHPQNASP